MTRMNSHLIGELCYVFYGRSFFTFPPVGDKRSLDAFCDLPNNEQSYWAWSAEDFSCGGIYCGHSSFYEIAQRQSNPSSLLHSCPSSKGRCYFPAKEFLRNVWNLNTKLYQNWEHYHEAFSSNPVWQCHEQNKRLIASLTLQHGTKSSQFGQPQNDKEEFESGWLNTQRLPKTLH